MAYFLTADGGTESIRVRLYDLEANCLASEAAEYPTSFGEGSRAEQDPADWWRNFVNATAKTIAASGVDASEIESLAYATTCCSVVALDENGNALRPALIWMDVRAHEEAEAVLATGDPALAVNSAGNGPVSAEWMLPKALWLKRNEPECFAKAFRICEYQDFLTFKLTGEWISSLNNVSLRWHHSTDRGGRPESLVKALDIEELLDKWPPSIVAPGELVGTLTEAAARELGLSESVKVVQGGADALIGMIGVGVAQPGQLALITGSSHLQFGITDAPLTAPGVWGAYADAVYPGRYIVEGGQTSTGSIINWFGRIAGKLDFDELNARAEKLEPGCDGLLVLDHFQGNRTPHTDALSRGAIVGLSLAHERHHIFRAIMEGIGFGTRAILDSFKAAGYTSKEITVAGGASNSNLWLQIHADTAGLPVRVPASIDAPSTGSAVLAAYGAGHFASIDEGIAAMVRPGRLIEPNQDAVQKYSELHAKYAQLYPALKKIRES